MKNFFKKIIDYIKMCDSAHYDCFPVLTEEEYEDYEKGIEEIKRILSGNK